MALIAVNLHGASLDSQQCGQLRLEGVWESHATLTDCNGHILRCISRLRDVRKRWYSSPAPTTRLQLCTAQVLERGGISAGGTTPPPSSSSTSIRTGASLESRRLTDSSSWHLMGTAIPPPLPSRATIQTATCSLQGCGTETAVRLPKARPHGSPGQLGEPRVRQCDRC